MRPRTAAGSRSARRRPNSGTTSATWSAARTSSPSSTRRSATPKIREHLAATFKQRTRDEWFEQLKETDLCIAPVYSLEEALDDPHNRHRGMVATVTGAGGEQVDQIGVGPKLSETPGRPRTVGPSAGAQTAEVLATIGYDAERIANLRTEGIIG